MMTALTPDAILQVALQTGSNGAAGDGWSKHCFDDQALLDFAETLMKRSAESKTTVRNSAAVAAPSAEPGEILFAPDPDGLRDAIGALESLTGCLMIVLDHEAERGAIAGLEGSKFYFCLSSLVRSIGTTAKEASAIAFGAIDIPVGRRHRVPDRVPVILDAIERAAEAAGEPSILRLAQLARVAAATSASPPFRSAG